MSCVRDLLPSILDAALAAVEPGSAVRGALSREGRALIAGGRVFPVAGRAVVLALGKAAVPMARAAAVIAGDLIGGGLVATHARPAGIDRVGPLPVVEAGHPVPDGRSVAAAGELAALASSLGPADLALVLLSGGGSALAALPAPGLSLDGLAAVTELLLKGGADIAELNCVRKHLSGLSGGRLAGLAHPAQALVLVLSDVPGDRLDVIASGPCTPDPTTYADALAVLDRRCPPGRVPPAVREHLERGARGGLPETPKPRDPIFDGVVHVLVGGGSAAAAAAAARAGELGFDAAVGAPLAGEAKEAGRGLAAEALELARGDRPACRVHAGETQVTVTGGGSGGRNQELALAAALELDGVPRALVAALGTDGRDGPTDAAGGVADGGTAGRVRAAGLDPGALLRDNDSHRALAAAGDLLVTGPTGTNVADLAVVLVGGDLPPRPPLRQAERGSESAHGQSTVGSGRRPSS